MKMKQIVPIMTTNKLAELKEFYTKHFDFKVNFDAPQYLGLVFEGKTSMEIGFMTPGENCVEFSGQGLTLGLVVENVDAEYDRIKNAGLNIVQKPQDNPWGDRSTIVTDPIGIAVYIYQPIEPTEEFKKYAVK